MRRIAFLAFACALPIPLAVLAYGCDARAPSIQDYCGFLRNEDNCYLTLLRDMSNAESVRCGLIDTAKETDDLSKWNARKGSFVARDKLDICVFEEGGSITFEEALDLEAFPPTGVGFTMKDDKGEVCGTFTFKGPYDYSIEIAPADSLGGDVVNVPDVACAPADGKTDDVQGTDDLGGDEVCGGSFISASPDGDFIDTTCGKEEHHFISSQLEQPACANQKALVPRYQIDAAPGGINADGHIAFRVFYPVANQDQTGASITSFGVTYFNCRIPAAPKACCNGVQDGSETGVDCGGNGGCDLCQAGQGCIGDGDCLNKTCIVEPTSGIKKCDPMNAIPIDSSVCDPPPDAGAGGSAGGGGAGGGAGGSGGSGGSGGAGGSGGN
ncbi:MAG TPA: hypothetical protein VE093_24235 [Polyangiaceae bacterium]|nr:hypothetical protein [Polyangiaceae bacterium]